MLLCSMDTETTLFAAGEMAPKIICASFADAERPQGILLTPHQAIESFQREATAGSIIAFANAPYDLACLAAKDGTLLQLIFDALRNRQIHDVLIAQALNDLGCGHMGLYSNMQPFYSPSTGKRTDRYSLELVTQIVLGRTDAKAHDDWRKSYGLLDGIPFERWPESARVYPCEDASNTYLIAAKQLSSDYVNIDNLPAQVEAAFALHLGACWGLITDGQTIEKLSAKVQAQYQEVFAKYQKFGWMRPDGTKDVGAITLAVAKAYGAVVGADGELDFENATMLPRTPKGGIKRDRDTMMESGNEDLADFAENEIDKVRTTYIPYLEKGIKRPLTFSPNVLVATGRCSYEKSPVHQFPRSGGVRECIRARPGYVLGSTDYEAGELCSLSQYCKWVLGKSQMLEIINQYGSPGVLHSELAAQILGIPVDEFLVRLKAKDKQAVDYRQSSKSYGFGKPSGMGSATMVATNRKKNVGFTPCEQGNWVNEKGERGYAGVRYCILIGGHEKCGKEMINEWKGQSITPVCKHCTEVVEHIITPAYFKRFPEMTDYFDFVSKCIDEDGGVLSLVWDEKKGEVVTTRFRKDVEFSAGCNNGFQAMLADIGKAAFCQMTREGYLGVKDDGSPSPLAGTRFPLYLHDEPLSEIPEEMAHLAGPRIAEIMMETGKLYAPDVTWAAATALMRKWTKGAEPVFDSDGKLTVWTPKG